MKTVTSIKDKVSIINNAIGKIQDESLQSGRKIDPLITADFLAKMEMLHWFGEQIRLLNVDLAHKRPVIFSDHMDGTCGYCEFCVLDELSGIRKVKAVLEE